MGRRTLNGKGGHKRRTRAIPINSSPRVYFRAGNDLTALILTIRGNRSAIFRQAIKDQYHSASHKASHARINVDEMKSLGRKIQDEVAMIDEVMYALTKARQHAIKEELDQIYGLIEQVVTFCSKEVQDQRASKDGKNRAKKKQKMSQKFHFYADEEVVEILKSITVTKSKFIRQAIWEYFNKSQRTRSNEYAEIKEWIKQAQERLNGIQEKTEETLMLLDVADHPLANRVEKAGALIDQALASCQ